MKKIKVSLTFLLLELRKPVLFEYKPSVTLISTEIIQGI